MERADLGPQFAIDGNAISARWAREQMSAAAWLLLDVAREVAAVNCVVIDWEPAFATSYKVQIATTAAGPFQDLFAATNGNGAPTTSRPAPRSGRYARMHGVARKTMYGYSLWEMTVYGDWDETCE